MSNNVQGHDGEKNKSGPPTGPVLSGPPTGPVLLAAAGGGVVGGLLGALIGALIFCLRNCGCG